MIRAFGFPTLISQHDEHNMWVFLKSLSRSKLISSFLTTTPYMHDLCVFQENHQTNQEKTQCIN